MHWRHALRGRHRRRRAGHHRLHARLSLRAAAALALLALAACAAAPRAPHTPPAVAVVPPSPQSAATARASFVAAASAMLGQPYRWGGAAPGGFDCSGLVFYAAAGAGLTVPRTAHELEEFGTPIARGDVQAGDLVFMRLERKELHVGIAVSARRFIHAPSHGGRVRIDALDAPPYARGFLGARRIIAGP